MSEDRRQYVGLVEFTQPTRFGWLRMATPTLRNYSTTQKYVKNRGDGYHTTTMLARIVA